MMPTSGSGISNDGADGDFNDPVFARFSVLIFAQSMLAAARLVLLLVAQIQKRRKLRIGQGDHVSTLSTIAAIGTATRDKFFAPEADTTAPAVTGDHADFYFVDELHLDLRVHHCLYPGKKKAPKGAS